MCSIEIEEDYIKKMQKLSSLQFPREEMFLSTKGSSSANSSNIAPHNLLGALQALPQQTSEICIRHTTLIESLKQNLLWPLEHCLREQDTVKKQHKQEMTRITKNKLSQEEHVERCKDRYYARCKEKAILVDANVAGQSGKQLEKVRGPF